MVRRQEDSGSTVALGKSSGLRRSELSKLTNTSAFLWLVGLEDTFITARHEKTGRTLDEYELTGHYERWRQDLTLAHELGIGTMRYGIPWHRINPERGKWDFTWAEPQISLLLEMGIEPIIDLVHYGTPSHIDNAFLHPDYPRYVAEYAARVAERFRNRVHCYTPLNEPRVTAWYAGKLGWWPPFARGWRGFLRVLLSVCRGIVETHQVLRDVDPEIVTVHVDATDLYEAEATELAEDVARRQTIVFLALDLISGRVNPNHSLYRWMLQLGVAEKELEWFEDRDLDLDVVGINLYPEFSRKILKRDSGRLRIHMPYADAGIVERLSELYSNRYRRPVIISETATAGGLMRRRRWLHESIAAVGRLRRRGVPVVGYTWWPMLALVTWAYRQGTKPPSYYLKQMGLWDLRPSNEGLLVREATALVDEYREIVQGGTRSVDCLASSAQEVPNVS